MKYFLLMLTSFAGVKANLKEIGKFEDTHCDIS